MMIGMMKSGDDGGDDADDGGSDVGENKQCGNENGHADADRLDDVDNESVSSKENGREIRVGRMMYVR